MNQKLTTIVSVGHLSISLPLSVLSFPAVISSAHLATVPSLLSTDRLVSLVYFSTQQIENMPPTHIEVTIKRNTFF